jgi:hypothetical protein
MERITARRRATDASYILGRLKSHEEYDFHLSLLTGLTESDPLVNQVAVSLGQIADPKAVPALLDYLGFGYDTAREYYATMNNVTGPTVQFDENSYADAIRALAAIDPTAGVTDMRNVVNLLINELRMSQANLAVVQVLAGRADKYEPAYLDYVFGQVIADRRYPSVARWLAARAVGTLKFQGAACTKAIDGVLNTERPARELILVAAWANQQTTGKTITLPQPVVNDPPQMTIRDRQPEPGN